MRTFERTHPWLTFRLDLRRAGHRFWMLLGEAQSKCEHIAAVPLRRATAEAVHTLYLAKGASATTAIEGNTLTEEQVLQHLEGRLHLPPSQSYLAQEVDNIVAACSSILSDLAKGRGLVFTPRRIKDLNRLVLKDLELPRHVTPGRVRTDSVVVAGYRGAPAEDCEHLLSRLCDWLDGERFLAGQGMEIPDGILKAIAAHVYIALIHPFGDGNGRTARLIEYQILVESGVPSAAGHLLSNHYNQTRHDYYKHLDRAGKSGGSLLPFMEYAVAGFVEGLKEQLEYIRQQQWDIAWRNFVDEHFRDRNSKGDVRRKHLVLDLSRSTSPVRAAAIPELTPRLALAYAKTSAKTLQRDTKALEDEGLIVRTDEGIRANREIILAFLPFRREREG